MSAPARDTATQPATQFLVADIQGTELTDADRIRLTHPALAGVILFARNYQSRVQLMALVADIRSTSPDLLIMTDQEGGRVQRFRGEGFTEIPPMGVLGQLYNTEPERALTLVQDAAWLLAAELRASGVDLGLAPVLDIDRGISRVVGDRSFGGDPDVVVTLAKAYLTGIEEAGMAAVGKHFPGHGGVGVDSHIGLPVDNRTIDELADDLRPFVELIRAGLHGVMPGHLRFPAVTDEAAGFSQHWLQTVLRGELGFQGAIFSDCLNMAGASVAGDVQGRVEKAFAAGCDLVLVCNNPDAVEGLLRARDAGTLNVFEQPENAQQRIARVQSMKGRPALTWEELLDARRWLSLLNEVALLR